MKVIIDRFEGDSAVIELPDRTFASVPAALFEGAKEGDVFAIMPDTDETQARKDKIAGLMKDIMANQ